jgi:hypothetical protein
MAAAMTRKAFCAHLMGGSVVLLIQSCGGGDDGPAATGCTDTIAANHGHVLMIATADLDSATDKVYDIQGSAAHTHTVTLTVAQLRALKAGMSVTVTSSPGAGHDHSVSAMCT